MPSEEDLDEPIADAIVGVATRTSDRETFEHAPGDEVDQGRERVAAADQGPRSLSPTCQPS